MIKESFVLRVLAVLFVFLALPLLIACFIMFQKDYEQSIAEARKDLETTARTRTHAIYHIKPFSTSFVGEVSQYLDLKHKMPKTFSKEMSGELAKIKALVGGAVELMLVVPTDQPARFENVATSDAHLSDLCFISRDHLPAIAKGGMTTFVRTIYSSENLRYDFWIYVAQAILSDDDSLLGYFLVRANINKDVELILQQGKELHASNFYAVSQEDGVVVYAENRKLLGQFFFPLSEETRNKFYAETHQEPGNAVIAEKPLPVNSEPGTNFFDFEFEKQIQLAFLPPPHEFGVSVLAYSPKQLVFNQAMHRFLFIYNAYGILLIVGGAVSYLLSLLMARPLRQLSTLMRNVGEGDLSKRFKEERFGYEINALGSIFNQTLDTLLENIHKAENYRVSKEKNQKELEIGYEVQRRLLPETMPKVQGVDIAATYVSSIIAGGDFYDFVEKDGDKLFLVVGDAATKGISPCFYALDVRSLVRAYSFVTDDVGKILTHSNQLFCSDSGDTGMFVTLLMGCYFAKDKIFSYYSCGHTAGLVKRANGHIELLDHRGMALGLDEESLYTQESLKLEKGDVVIFYTDGLIHAVNEKNQYFTRERVINCLQHRNWKTAQEIVSGLVEEVTAYMGGNIQEGEITIVVMRVTE